MDGFAGSLDDSISAASTSDVQDRLSALELRVQQQEDEITVLKAALADVLRRLAISEDHVASVKKSVPSKGQPGLREAISMSCITNGSGANRKPSHTSSVAIARKETLSSAAKSGTEKKKEKPQGQREKKEESHSNDQSPQIRASPSPQPSSQPLQIHRQTQESKNSTPTKSIKRTPTAEKSHNSWENSDESRNKLLRAVSTSKLISKVIKNADKHKDVIINQAKMSTREKNNQEGEYVKMFMRGRPITMFIPSDVENYDDIRTELPPEKLKLEWVYGYRGKDCRANVYLLPTGEIVYFIASVVVLFNYEERTQRHYLGHTDCVKCLAIHPDKIRIATGQIAGVDKDGRPLQPHVRVWDSVSLSTLQIIGLGTFERGVGCLDFSKADSGVHLCVIDDSNEHMLTVWDWQKKSKGAEIKTTNEVVLAVEFHPTDANTIITCGKSHIFFWTWSGNSLTRKQGIFGKYEKPKFVQCLAFLGNGDVLTGDSGGVILIWSKTTVEPTPGKGPKGVYQISKQIKAHDGSVFTLCQMRNGMLLTGGGKDRKIILWDHDLNPEREIEVPDQYGTIRAVAEGKTDQFLVGTSRNFILRGTFNDGFQIEVQGHTDELWGLATHPFKDLLLTCAQDRQVCMWNSVDHRLEWTRLVDEPGHCADFHPSGTVVAIGTHSGRWFVLDAETRDLVSIHTDGNEQLSVMRYSVDGTLLAVGSHDNFIYLYVVSENGRKYSRHGKCTGHSSYITHLDWSPDNKYIMSNSGDYEILYWDIPSGCKLIRNRSDCKDTDWTTYTCVLGFQVFGVWPEGSDGTDINALVRSHNRKVIAVADDFCKVHLFQYPCSKAKAPSHKYSAHSSHVTNVSFTHNDSHLISTGGKDMSIIQWKLVEKLSLPQNEIVPDGTLTKAPISSVESAVQSDTPTPPPSQPLNETAEEESRISNSPTLLENSLEQTMEPSEDHMEEQSEGSSEDLGEPLDEEPSREISKEQRAAPPPEDQQDPAPLS
ncbi:echinoderm microtubule-associated protein-like 4 [Lycaon pictus]|uniref:Echinoderm microtubule-associated protein-like 4 n=2 Tax=Canis lupus familiaris TaxID=9615 RepID=A0A8C0MX38_CANLF|nr:echinoderm microtubule-associated protein-like 4 isoform X1 [Canis lupus familiaris]XP_025309842.1 echinoderm microtubule-associated protein-like 4 isoform X1 [Canis lupus dingo]XP_038417275.1 echinoderm microtubule-associated protein-like 4 isoform X1 [Canis lupus familiaris]XP_038547257.1 echinoderm microtubule-associated protein-like 4 isoform X1 [Canis lupus familiaris]|eukprot:XP_005630437.1 echinoderm microtubule-associated protein-like 4 isoform X3 [Canis lupus familiaris]